MRTIIWISIIMFTASQVLSLPRNQNTYVCPLFKCVEIVPAECAEPTYFRLKGQICRGCDRNICQEGTVSRKN